MNSINAKKEDSSPLCCSLYPIFDEIKREFISPRRIVAILGLDVFGMLFYEILKRERFGSLILSVFLLQYHVLFQK